jgi:hypothetical protein
MNTVPSRTILTHFLESEQEDVSTLMKRGYLFISIKNKPYRDISLQNNDGDADTTDKAQNPQFTSAERGDYDVQREKEEVLGYFNLIKNKRWHWC